MTATATVGHDAQIIACDTGGTMTDVIVVDTDGHFTIGKASTTPDDQSVGFVESLRDAFHYWDIDFDQQAHRLLRSRALAKIGWMAMSYSAD